MTNKELSMKIRKSLKEAGYTQKDIKVSVRSSRYDTAAKITIHNPHIDRHRIEKILRPAYEEIDRDDITGEILQGGNTMLFIEYEYGVFEDVAREWMATAKGLMQSKAEVTRIFDGLYLLDQTTAERWRSGNRTRIPVAHIECIASLICVNSSTNSQNSKRSQYDRARKKTEKICLK